MNSYVAAITDYGFPDLAPEAEILEPAGFRLLAGQSRTSDEVIELCRSADAILTQWAPVNREVIEQLERCRIIVRYGIGVDNVDLDAARERNIPVVNVPDYAVEEVADHAMALLLAAVRKIPAVVAQVRNGVWDIAPKRPIVGLTGRTLGLAGFGNIARAVARRAQAFGMQTVAYDPYASETVFAEYRTERVGWEALLDRSDFISVHLPLTSDTRHLVNGEALRRMKPGAFLINTSRGGVVQTEALTEALGQGVIAGAALDVLEQEPIPNDHPLLSMDNCLITSHCAWYSEDSLKRLQSYAAMEVRRLFEGGVPKHIVNGVKL